MNPYLSLLGLVLFVGVVLWGVRYLPFIDENFKKIIYVIIVILTAVFVLNWFGIMPGLPIKHN